MLSVTACSVVERGQLQSGLQWQLMDDDDLMIDRVHKAIILTRSVNFCWCCLPVADVLGEPCSSSPPIFTDSEEKENCSLSLRSKKSQPNLMQVP